MNKKMVPPKSQSLQGEVPPDAAALAHFVRHGHQHGPAGADADAVDHAARYQGDAASAASPSGNHPVYRHDDDGSRKRGPAPRSEAQSVPGSDAQPGNIGLSK